MKFKPERFLTRSLPRLGSDSDRDITVKSSNASASQARALAAGGAALASAFVSFHELLASHYPVGVIGWLLATRLTVGVLRFLVHPETATNPLDEVAAFLCIFWMGIYGSLKGSAALPWILPAQLALMLFVDSWRAALAVSFGGLLAMLVGPDALHEWATAAGQAFVSVVVLAMRGVGWPGKSDASVAMPYSRVWGSAAALSWQASSDTTAYSPAFKTLLGYGPSKNRAPYNFFDLVHPSDRPTLERAFRAEIRAARRGQPLSAAPAQVRLVARDGNWRWMRADIVSLSLNHAQLVECVATFVDITPEVVAQEALAASRRAMQMQAIELAKVRSALEKCRESKMRLEQQVAAAFEPSLRALATALADLRPTAQAPSEPLGDSLEHVGQHLSQLMERLRWALDASNLEDGRYQPERAPVDMGRVGRYVLAGVSVLAQGRRVAVELEEPESLDLALADEVMCRRALEALARDAVMSAPKGARVVLCATQRAGRVGLELRMAHALRAVQRARFFDPPPSSGELATLGPYWARLIARAHGGDLTLGTAASGAASLFFLLPAHASQGGKEGHKVLDLVVLGRDAWARQVKAACDGWDASVRPVSNDASCIHAIVQRRPDLIVAEYMPDLTEVRATMNRVRGMQLAAGEEPTNWVIWLSKVDELQPLEVTDFAARIDERRADRDMHALLQSTLAEKNVQADRVWVDPAMLQAMPDYVESRKVLVVALKRAIKSGRRAEATRLANRLGGSPGFRGFEAAVAACRSIAYASAAESTEHLLLLADDISALVERVDCH
jgi:PAS domain-containing protein